MALHPNLSAAPRRRLWIVSLAVAATAVAGAVAAPAAEASGWPATPSGVHVSNAGQTWFTVAARKAANATSYRLYASTVKSDVYYVNVVHGRHGSARRTVSRRSPSLTLSGLKYSTAVWYYRVESLKGSQHSYARIMSTGLRPATPTSPHATASARGTYLTWSSGGATGFTIAQATNSAMTSHRRNYTISDTSHQFTPYGLTKGVRYWYSLRALTNGMPSHWTGPVSVVPAASETSTRVMTYNVLHLMFDGTKEGNQTVAPWSQRRVAAASLIKSVNPDIIGVQEANDWANSAKTYREVDSLRGQLATDHETYTVAHTEALESEAAYRAKGPDQYLRTGNYILYKPSVYKPIGTGGHWLLATKVYAVYQLLQNVNTGARLLVVNTHLTQPGGHANDVARQSETRKMVSDGSAKGASDGAPVTYLGDFNSNTKQDTLDGPGSIMRESHIADTRLVAQAHTNPHWDSVNDYLRAPYHYDLYIDYIWATPGVSAWQWGMALHMSHGKFVGVMPSDHNPVWAQLHFSS